MECARTSAVARREPRAGADDRHPHRRSAQWCVLDMFEDLPSFCPTGEDQQAAIHAIQGLMWRTYAEEGTLSYSFVDSLLAMYPYYIARAFGGLLFLIGAVVATYNIWMTVRGVPVVGGERHDDVPLARPVPEGAAAGPAE